MMMGSRLLKTADVAERLAVSPATIRKWIFAGRLPTVHVGRAVRVREEDIEALVRMGYTPVRRGAAGKSGWVLR